jgi:hypothetical protein
MNKNVMENQALIENLTIYGARRLHHQQSGFEIR